MSDKNRAMIDELVQGLDVSIEAKSNFWKIESKVNGHKIYVQTGDTLKKIETTLPIKDQPGTSPLPSHNGKITCRIVPEREHLANFLKMMNDTSLAKLEKRGPRPGEVRAVKVKAPKNTGTPQVEGETSTSDTSQDELKSRLAKIHEAAKKARENRKLEESGGSVSEDVAVEEVFDAPDVNTDLGARELAVETGVEVIADA